MTAKQTTAKSIFVWVKEGGDGKTTTAVNTAKAMADAGKRVLLVDLDENAKATLRSGLNPDKFSPTLYHVFVNKVPISQVIQKTSFGFDIVPGHSLTAVLQGSLEEGDEKLLQERIAPVLPDYDFVIFDTEPGKHLLTYNAFSAADYLLIPMQAQSQGLVAVTQTIHFVRDVIWKQFNPGLKIIGIFLIQVRRISPTSLAVVKQAREIWGDKVLPFEVPETDLFSQAFDAGKPALAFRPKHKAVQPYRRLAKYISTKSGK